MKQKIRTMIGGNYILSVVQQKIVKSLFEHQSDLAPADFSYEEVFDLTLKWRKNFDDIVVDNNMYGHSGALQRITAKSNRAHCYIEHGNFFGGHIQFDANGLFTKNFITQSSRRARYLEKKLGVKCQPVGPYITYAPSSKNSSFRKYMKAKLGTVFLYFPFHSSNFIDSKRSTSVLDQLGSNYDTKIACVFYRELITQPDYINRLKSMGYQIVCAGHRFDRYFLDKLRFIIELGDESASDYVGAPIAYCYALGLRHTILESVESSMEKQKNTRAYDSLYQKYMEQMISETSEICDHFVIDNISSDKDRADVMNKYYGINDVIHEFLHV